jgi:hypothetical protein
MNVYSSRNVWVSLSEQDMRATSAALYEEGVAKHPWFPLYLTTNNIHNRQTDSQTAKEFDPPVSASEWPQTHALEPAATVHNSAKADSHTACRAHAASMPCPCHAMPLIHTCHAVPLPLPCSDSAASFVKARVVAGNIRTASPTV